MVELRIKEVLAEKNITPTRLGVISGIEKSYISALLNGKKNPTLETLSKIATALEVSIADLFEVSPKGDGFMAVVDYDGKLRRFDSIGALEAFIGEIRGK